MCLYAGVPVCLCSRVPVPVRAARFVVPHKAINRNPSCLFPVPSSAPCFFFPSPVTLELLSVPSSTSRSFFYFFPSLTFFTLTLTTTYTSFSTHLKTMLASTLLVSAFAAVMAAAELTVNTPSGLTFCQPSLLSWSGGTAPYYLTINQGGSTSAVLETLLSASSVTSYTWIVDVAAATSVTVAIKDSTGATNFAQAVTVAANPTGATTCNSASSAAASASSIAATASSVSGTVSSAVVASVSSAASSATSAASSAVSSISASSSAASSSIVAASKSSSASAASSSSVAASASSKASASASAASSVAASAAASASASATKASNAFKNIAAPVGALGVIAAGSLLLAAF